MSANIELFCLIGEVGITGQVTGFSMQSASWPCWPLSGPIENPQPLKAFSLLCFHWLRPYLNTLKHSHTPRTQHQLKALTEQLDFFYLFILGLTRLGARTVLHFDLSSDWLEIRSGCPWTELLPSPKAHLLWLWLIYCWPGISVFFVSNRWNVRCLSDPTCWAALRAVERALCLKCLSL